MVYQGSKARILKDIKPFIQNCIVENNVDVYIEPFVGGANVIPYIEAKYRIGLDNNRDLIALLCHIQENPRLAEFPETCDFEHYTRVRESRKLGTHDFPLWYKAGIGYFASFGGKYFGGYARAKGRDMYAERLKRARKEAPMLRDIFFNVSEYNKQGNILIDKNYMIYCDPPYKGTTSYGNKDFDYEVFYNWLRQISKNHFVLISEYSMPDDFAYIWSREIKTLMDSSRDTGIKACERLFTLKGGMYDVWFNKKK